MTTCVVKGCLTKSFPRSSLRFYGFPGNPARRQLWLSSVQLKGHLTADAAVCGLHFRPEDYDEQMRLRVDAVPREVDEMRNYVETNALDAPDTSMEDFDSDEPDVLKVCRICLDVERKTFDLKSSCLLQAYSDLIGTTVSPADALPRRLCRECAARVRAAARLRARALRAQEILTQLVYSHGELTMHGIYCVNRQENKLSSELTDNCVQYYNYELHDDADDVKLEREEIFACKLPEYVDDAHDYDQDEDLEKHRIDPMDEDKIIQVNGFLENSNEVDDKKDRIVMDLTKVNADIDEVKDNNDVLKDIIKVIEVKDIVRGKKQDSANGSAVKTVKKRPVKRKVESVETVTEKRPVKKGKRKEEIQPTRAKYLDEFIITNVTLEEEIAEVQKRKESRAYQRAPYKCDICYRTHIVREKYEAHMLKHTEKYGQYECAVCRTRYQKERFMRHHVKELHTEKYTCKKCPFVTRIKTVASNHVKFHNGTKYKCPHCPKEFDRTTTYYNHLRVKHACDFVCELCGHTFLSKRGVLRHQSSVHKFDMDTTLAGPHCAACAVTFASDAAHARHLRMSSRHNQGEDVQNDYRPAPGASPERRRREFSRPGTPITCEQCETTLPSRKAYAYHFRKEHRGLARTAHPVLHPAVFMCEQCGRKFQSMSILKNHKFVHTGVRNFKCSVCDKAFVTRMTLYAHMRLHRDTPPSFACSVCGKTFNSQSNRDRHMFIHTGLKPFECEACGKRTGTLGELRLHIDHVHNKKPWPKRQRRRRAPTED